LFLSGLSPTPFSASEDVPAFYFDIHTILYLKKCHQGNKKTFHIYFSFNKKMPWIIFQLQFLHLHMDGYQVIGEEGIKEIIGWDFLCRG